jgi:hypothetical protein
MPGTRQIFAGVSGSPGSVHALRHAADLACHHDALMIRFTRGCRPKVTSTSASTPAWSCASYEKATPGSACGTSSMPPGVPIPLDLCNSTARIAERATARALDETITFTRGPEYDVSRFMDFHQEEASSRRVM